MSDFVAVLGAVLLLGCLVGTMFTLFRNGLNNSPEAEDFERPKAGRKDKIVELANAVEDRNNLIATMQAWAITVKELHPDVNTPQFPDWWVEDGRL